MPSSQYVERIRAGIGHALLLTPGVVVVFHDSAGRLLLVRSATSGEWGLPAGHIEPGESPRAAALRELREESGIRCADLVLAAALGGPGFRYTYPNGDQVEYVIFVYGGRGPANLRLAPEDTEEVSEAAFFSQDDAPPLTLPYPQDMLWSDA